MDRVSIFTVISGPLFHISAEEINFVCTRWCLVEVMMKEKSCTIWIAIVIVYENDISKWWNKEIKCLTFYRAKTIRKIEDVKPGKWREETRINSWAKKMEIWIEKKASSIYVWLCLKLWRKWYFSWRWLGWFEYSVSRMVLWYN